jgi:hypothetical protein
MHRQRDFLLALAMAMAMAMSSAWAQDLSPAVAAGSAKQSRASIPDFSGAWTKPYIGIESPASGPGPVTNRSRRTDGLDGDGGMVVDPDYRGKHLQLEFTVEDEGVFTMPWSATVTYRRALGTVLENICAENLRGIYVHKDSAVPRADRPDF